MICVSKKEITVIYLHILQYVVPLLFIAPSWGNDNNDNVYSAHIDAVNVKLLLRFQEHF